MNRIKLIIAGVFALSVTWQAYPQESSVYLLGSGGSFSPLLPPTGFAGKSITSVYRASKYADRNGDTEKVSDRIYGFFQQFTAFYVTRLQLLGANYVVGGMIPFATAEINPSQSLQIRSRLFMADPYISPIGLSWQKSDYQLFAE